MKKKYTAAILLLATALGSITASAHSANKVSMKIHNVLIVTIELADAKPNRTMEQAVDTMFKNSEFNVDQAMRVASYGQMGLRLGDDSGMDPTIELKYDDKVTSGIGGNTLRMRAAKDLAEMGYKMDNFRFVFYILPKGLPGGAAGAASLNGQWSTYKVFWYGTIIHELGHCLGGNHSGQEPGCALGWANVNYNAVKKIHFGWLKAFPNAVTDITTGKSVTLVPLNQDPQKMPGLRVAKVAMPDGKNYYISYRVNEEPYRKLSSAGHSQKVFVTQDLGGSLSKGRAKLAAGEEYSNEVFKVTCDSVAEDGMSARVTIEIKS